MKLAIANNGTVMNYFSKLRLVLVILGGLFVTAFLVREEMAWRQERGQLEAEIRAAHGAARQAVSRQRKRESELQQALRQIDERKRNANTPEEVVQALPRELPLPAPITLPAKNARQPEGSQQHGATAQAQVPEHPAAALPVEDLKPLYDFALNCRACQARLAASEANLADERQRRMAVERELAAETKLARGGGFWRRAGRAAKWFLVGAAAGAVAASARR
jgi:hypothetical protein